MQGREEGRPPRVLIVEDDGLISFLLERMVEELGCIVVGSEMSLEGGLKAAEAANFDLALLDINLGGLVRSFPIARKLRESGIPFIYVTGYGRAGLDGMPDVGPVLTKPIRSDDLRRCIDAVLGSSEPWEN